MRRGKKTGMNIIFDASLLFQIPVMDGRLFNKLLTNVISSLSHGNFSPYQQRSAVAA